jgi:hypothetical protein
MLMTYLCKLHEQIDSIVSIEGVQDLGNNTFHIEYLTEPSSEQLTQVNNIIADWPLRKAKLEKLEQVDISWKTTMSNGWTTPYGWKLGTDTQDVTLLTGAFILAKEANSMGLSTTGTVIDMDGQSHELSLQDMTILMLQYGQFRSQLSSQDALKRELINNANSIDSLNQII